MEWAFQYRTSRGSVNITPWIARGSANTTSWISRGSHSFLEIQGVTEKSLGNSRSICKKLSEFQGVIAKGLWNFRGSGTKMVVQGVTRSQYPQQGGHGNFLEKPNHDSFLILTSNFNKHCNNWTPVALCQPRTLFNSL